MGGGVYYSFLYNKEPPNPYSKYDSRHNSTRALVCVRVWKGQLRIQGLQIHVMEAGFEDADPLLRNIPIYLNPTKNTVFRTYRRK